MHKKTVLATITIQDEAGQIHKETDTFGSVTSDLLTLHDWLIAHRVTHVAIESTGVCWKPAFNLVEDSFEILLVDTKHI